MQDPRPLRHAVALAEHGSFSRAARSLGLTQPALSKSIRALENGLGCRLFERQTTPVVPTPAGRALLARARPLLAALDDLAGAVGASLGVQLGRFALGSSADAATSSVAAALGHLLSSQPQLEMRIELRPWEQLEAGLRARELDVVVTERGLAEHDPDFRVTPVPVSRGVWFCRAGHPLARRERVTIGDIVRFPLAMPVMAPADAATVQKQRAEHASNAGVVTCARLDFLRRLVAHTDCVGAATHDVIAEDLESGLLVELRTELPPRGPHIGLVTLRGRPLPPAVQRFATALAAG